MGPMEGARTLALLWGHQQKEMVNSAVGAATVELVLQKLNCNCCFRCAHTVVQKIQNLQLVEVSKSIPAQKEFEKSHLVTCQAICPRLVAILGPTVNNSNES